MEPILSKEQSIILYRTSHLLFVSSALAFYNGYYDIGLCNSALLLTSLNFWQNPVYGWQRNLDIVVAKSCILFQSYRAIDSDNSTLYYFFISKTIFFYLLGMYFYYVRKDTWRSVYSHALCHIMGNVASIILYSSGFRPDTVKRHDGSSFSVSN